MAAQAMALMDQQPPQKRQRLRLPARRLQIGTDCSGIDVSVAMLQELIAERKVKSRYTVEHVFSSEVDIAARAIIEYNFSPRYVYNDLTTRALFPPQDASAASRRKAASRLPAASELRAASRLPAASELRGLDIYVAGFPCQPWSSAGKQEGFMDEKGRGMLWTHIVQFIIVAKPKCVILENVVGITRGKSKSSFTQMLEMLKSIEAYKVQHKVLNTRDFGVPQNRERVFVIMLLKSTECHPFKWPEKVPADSLCLDSCLDDKESPGPVDLTTLPTGKAARKKLVQALTDMMSSGSDPHRTPAVCSLGNRRSSTMVNCCPCLTAARAKEGGHWLMHRARFMTMNELFRLQGLPPSRWKVPQGVPEGKMKLCIGNAICGNVIKLLLAAAMEALGLFD